MVKGRERKREGAGQDTGWLTGILDLLRGTAIGLAAALAVLAASAGLISFGLMSDAKTDAAVIAACLVGGLLGGTYTVRRRIIAPLPAGLGVSVMLFAFLLTAGALFYEGTPAVHSGGVLACACLCGGGLAGVLGGSAKKKRHK